jgi:hypothetical protein
MIATNSPSAMSSETPFSARISWVPFR